ncbi:DUF4395 domain-containing protein [Nocardioides bruguierae]|uniref:DUF4395 domain-containing protein n=1 Tax=Nocardioides bruguierae TaxID=2945102 RepID=A0A9X2IFH8_9ACTN|nr:DUF4395 domain-containing protein [Nocardioides bruguierae]MCM0621861.1 DUF4395 domain-containing protein [Nocardioides bruguierae]
MSTLEAPVSRGTQQQGQRGIDPRAPQFNAIVTAVVLVAILVTPTPVAIALTALQAALFATGAIRGVQKTPHAWAFRTFVKPRLSAPTELEAPEPPRFAQAVGLVFTVVALVGFAAGVLLLAQVAIGFALVAATLNAVFRFCLGCELFLVYKRALAARIA